MVNIKKYIIISYTWDVFQKHLWNHDFYLNKMGLAILITKSQNQRISNDTNSVDCKVEYKYGVINGLKSLRFKIPKTCV